MTISALFQNLCMRLEGQWMCPADQLMPSLCSSRTCLTSKQAYTHACCGTLLMMLTQKEATCISKLTLQGFQETQFLSFAFSAYGWHTCLGGPHTLARHAVNVLGSGFCPDYVSAANKECCKAQGEHLVQRASCTLTWRVLCNSDSSSCMRLFRPVSL